MALCLDKCRIVKPTEKWERRFRNKEKKQKENNKMADLS